MSNLLILKLAPLAEGKRTSILRAESDASVGGRAAGVGCDGKDIGDTLEYGTNLEADHKGYENENVLVGSVISDHLHYFIKFCCSSSPLISTLI